MASRYWIGGTGNWNDGTKWSTSTGGSAGATVIDSYASSNYDGFTSINTNASFKKARGQTFTGTGSVLGYVNFYLRNGGSTPTGNAFAKIYAITGTMGTTAVPTGSALATSDAFDATLLTTSPKISTFIFSGANQITLTNGTNYAVVVEYTASSSVSVGVGADQSSPTAHGNGCSQNQDGSWNAVTIEEYIFYVYSGSNLVPTSSDDVIFDSNSFTGASKTLTSDVLVKVKSMNWSTVTHSPTFNMNFFNVELHGGDLTLASGMTLSNGNQWSFYGQSSTMNITTAGKTLSGYYFYFANDTAQSASIFSLSDDMTVTDTTGNGLELHGAITFNTNNHNVTIAKGGFYADDTATINLGTSTLTSVSDVDFGYSTFSGPNTLSALNATIIMNNDATITGPYYYSTPYQTIGNLVINRNINLNNDGTTVNNLTIKSGVTVSALDGNSMVIGNSFNANGTSGSPIVVVNSGTLTHPVFSKAASTVRAYHMTLTNIQVTGGAQWYAYNSTDNGGNTGWTFASATSYNANDGGFITM